jgi:hypothetical protein
VRAWLEEVVLPAKEVWVAEEGGAASCRAETVRESGPRSNNGPARAVLIGIEGAGVDLNARGAPALPVKETT